MVVDYEEQYDNRRRVPEVSMLSARWRSASQAYRDVARAKLDQPYGPGKRHRYDTFLGAADAAPMVVYVHGGYWQWGDRTMYSFLARELNCSGINVAIPSYSLCPAVSVEGIAGELRMCLAVIWKEWRVRPLLVGHSAGGHLTAAMLGADWSGFADVPSDLVSVGLAISGIFDLTPLVQTSLNEAIGLSIESARAASPRFWSAPPKQRALAAAVGEHESSEFHRQSRDIVEHWGRGGVDTEYLEIPGTNHFTVLEELVRPDSALFKRVVTMARHGRSSRPQSATTAGMHI